MAFGRHARAGFGTLLAAYTDDYRKPTMRTLPRSAQLYLWMVYLLGAGIVARALEMFCAGRPLPGMQGKPWELALFAALAVLAGSKKIHLAPKRLDKEAGSMNLLLPITFSVMLRFGPSAATLVVLIGCLSGGLFPRRQAAHQLFFNLALAAIHVWCAGWFYLRLNGETLALNPVASFPNVAGACLIYYAINTGGVALIIALCSGQNVAKLWRQTFLWTAPSYFAGACISAGALIVFGSHVGVAVLFGTPIAYFIYQSYAVTIARAEEKQQHIEALQENQAHLADLYLATIKSLALAIDAKDQYTHQHILRVQRYSMATARAMGLEGNELEGLNTGALLHDIGKLGVPEYVLLKPGRLTDEEFAKIKKHPEIGAAILDPVEFPWPVLPVVKYHHEKWDGTGYPEGLAGEAIPRTARILAVADVYDALTSNRSYRGAWAHERALDAIIQDTGTHFDPKVVHAFAHVIGAVVEEMAREEAAKDQETASEEGEGSAPRPSDQAALAINRASSELWALYEVAQTLSSSLGLQETLEILSRKLEAILPGTACLFLLKGDSPDVLVVRTAVGVNREFFLGARTWSASSLSLRSARSRETYVGGYDADDLLPSSSEVAQWTALNSSLIVPIVHQGEVLGTINLYHPQEAAFGPHDQQLLETIAERAAMALYNGLLFDRTRSHALTDPLTGLYNVRHLTQYVEDHCTRWAGDNPEPFALLCLDLDSFKPINDNFGHQKGDQVLRDLSALFQSAVREADIVARYGGDEFLIVLHGVGALEAETMSRRLQESVAGYDPGLFHERLGNLRLGVSIGYGCFPQEGRDCASLLSAADNHMYRNKTERKLGSLASRDAAPVVVADSPLLTDAASADIALPRAA